MSGSEKYIWGTGSNQERQKIFNRSLFSSEVEFDWENDTHPHTPWKDTIIYEAHVRGFTKTAPIDLEKQGTYLGFIEKLDYLKSLGITAIELMPLHEFDECENNKINLFKQNKLFNFWGYSPVHFFQPMRRYASIPTALQAEYELKLLVKEAHKRGLEIILDVVFNHTGELDKDGPVYNLKGLCPNYYMRDSKGELLNLSGCGNTLNANYPKTIELIINSLRHYVINYHIDGFRFDLASLLTRDEHAIPLNLPPIINLISKDCFLFDKKLFVEAWDPAGLYQVGNFPFGEHFREWNGIWRDTSKKYLIGREKSSFFATSISGQQDLYHNRSPLYSVNFLTSHDGFTLLDWCSYNQKNNWNNGQNNIDGDEQNFSWNCGVEGSSSNSDILALRNRQIRNAFTALFLSQGVPFMNMGDEDAHTKLGNNNTWCHDSILNYKSWSFSELQPRLFRFIQQLIRLRNRHACFRKENFLSPQDVSWTSLKNESPNWDGKTLSYFLYDDEDTFFINFNPTNEELEIELLRKDFFLIIDTHENSPRDIEIDSPSLILTNSYRLKPYSCVVFKTNHELACRAP